MPGSSCVLAALVLIEQDQKFLLVRESKEGCRGKWFFPGGRSAPDESILQTAVREVREETGVLAELTGLLYIDQLTGSASVGGANRLRFVFTGKAIGGALKQAEDEHSICAGWFSGEEIECLELRSPFVRKIIGIHRENPPPLPMAMVHFLTPEDLLLEQP